MKLANTAILAICLAATPAFAAMEKTLKTTSTGFVTQTEMDTCITVGELAEVVQEAENLGVPKHKLYSLIIQENMKERDADLARSVINGVYAGLSANKIFDLCLETSKKH